MINRKINLLIVITIIFCLTTGCIPKAENLNQKTYLFSVNESKPILLKPNSGTVQISETTIAASFADNAFVYRTSDVNYTKDYYNIFFTSPSQQINEILFNKIQESNLFKNVEHTSSPSAINFIIKSNINLLYADYRDPKNPQGIFSLSIKLYKQTPLASQLIFEKTYTQTTIIEPQDSMGLMSAWNNDINLVFNQLIPDINEAIKKSLVIKPIISTANKTKNYNTLVMRVEKN